MPISTKDTIQGTITNANFVPWSGVTGKPSSYTPASHTHSYAGSASAGGSATSAVKLDTATAGSATQPVYFTGGKPVATTYTLGKSVPSDAVFTDHTYSAATQSANGLMTAADKKKLDAFASAGTYATQTYVGQQIAAAGHITKTIVTALPAVADAKDNVIYMIKKSSGQSGNLYDEYMLIDGALEKVGDTETKISTLSNADIEEILGQI